MRSEIKNKEIITALLQNGTPSAAAKALAIPENSVLYRLNSVSFQAELLAAKRELLHKAVYAFCRKLDAAIEVVSDIMTDDGYDPQTRLEAAQTIISYAMDKSNLNV